MPPPHWIFHFQERMSVGFVIEIGQTTNNFYLGLHKYSENVYEACIRSFCALPIAGLVDGKFFCVHGGLSPQLMHLRDLDNVRFHCQWFFLEFSYSLKLNRHQEPGSHGLLCDLLWSDPIAHFGTDQEPRVLERGFIHNGVRGCSFFYT